MCDTRERIAPLSLQTAAGAVMLTAVFIFLIPSRFFAAPETPEKLQSIGRILPGFFLVCTLFALFILRHEKMEISRIRKTDIPVIVAAYLCAVAFPGALTSLWKNFLDICGFHAAPEQALLTFARTGSTADFYAVVLLTVIFVPVAEEITFRRALYAMLSPFGEKTAFVLSAAGFSAAHFFLVGAPGLFVLGAIFQMTFLKTRNLSAAILVHALFNLTSLAVTRFLT